MARNIEIKARVRDEGHISEYMLLHSSQHETQHQRDVFFHTSSGRLKLRCFPDGTGVLVAYERADQAGPKMSDYTLAPVQDAATLERALTRSLGVRGIVEKRREIAIVGQTRVHLDQVAGLGTFMELEVVLRPEQSVEEGQAIAEELMRDLRIPPSDLLERAYMDMLEEKEG
jgi:predicted adenylyl cyclase CyaB